MVGEAQSLHSHPAVSLLAIAGSAVAGVLAVPRTLLMAAAVLAFASLTGFFYSLSGAELSTLLNYVAGQGAGAGIDHSVHLLTNVGDL